jgi:hypothetical protein
LPEGIGYDFLNSTTGIWVNNETYYINVRDDAWAVANFVADYFILGETRAFDTFFLVQELTGNLSLNNVDGIIGMSPSCVNDNTSFIEILRNEGQIDNWSFKATSEGDGLRTTLELGAPLDTRGVWA